MDCGLLEVLFDTRRCLLFLVSEQITKYEAKSFIQFQFNMKKMQKIDCLKKISIANSTNPFGGCLCLMIFFIIGDGDENIYMGTLKLGRYGVMVSENILKKVKKNNEENEGSLQFDVNILKMLKIFVLFLMNLGMFLA
ncbi:hypothetical protein U3516DRAFT_736329 [Neocallimastix sp. 'constans']